MNKRNPRRQLEEREATSPPYADRYAELYDIFYQAKPYEQEAKFVHECLGRHGVATGGRLLELACGTGKHAVQFAKHGYAVTATDYSPGMIEIARERARREKVEISFEQRDMRKLEAPDRPFDAAVCLFDAIGYVQTMSAVGEVFRGVRASLRQGGLFVAEFWHAPAVMSGFDPVRVRRFGTDGAMILRISETELDREKSLARVTYSIYELRDDATYRHTSECHATRYFTVAELDAQARQHGFIPLAAHDGFQDETAVSDQTWHVLAVWQKVN